MSNYDLVIRGGRVIDGSGAEEKTADLESILNNRL